MKTILIITTLLLVGCATKPTGQYIGKVRTTYYCAAEDKKWGDQVAMHPKMRAAAGVTVAVDPKVIPYGTHINIPALKKEFGDSYFIAEDTGAHVKKKIASKGKALIIDIYVDNRKEMDYLASTNPPYMDAYLIK